ncbi:voltage-dependent calcium channel subunit alpha-2/delta-3-like isoform X2 [Brevipalpus obovatus]
MFDRKRTLANNVAKKAEELAEKHVFNNTLKFDFPDIKRLYDPGIRSGPTSNGSGTDEYRLKPEDSKFYPARVEPDPKFNNVSVNYRMSAIHIPTNVYYGLNHTKNSIKWSAGLDQVFISNRDQDPDSYWQFFCSNDGFMRVYPLHQWRYPDFFFKTAKPSGEPENRKPLDLYDCRMTQWFIKAASSPKDMIILIDTSGSMKGQRRAIAQNVILNLLDTLTDNDYVNVFNFSSEIDSMVECFQNTLVPANKQNIQTFKLAAREFRVNNQSDMVKALQKAYSILGDMRKGGSGAQCNQMIVMITDGAVEDLQDHIRRFDPDRRVRIFSYLVGKEITEIWKTRNMACNNRGRFSHIKDFSEIREHAQQYVPVLSRPIVLDQASKPIEDRIYAYTSVYADVTELELAPWLWDALERHNIREAFKRRLERLNPKKDEDAKDEEDGEEGVGEEGADDSGDEGKRNDVVSDGDGIDDGESKRSTSRDDSNDLNNRVKSQSDEKDYGNEIDKDAVPLRRSRQIDDDIGSENRDKIEERRKKLQAEANEKASKRWKILNMKKKSEPHYIFDMMITLAVPVLNKTNSSILGVAGVDISLREIAKSIPFYMLGVNGYSFMINNNGHVIFHPDLRPMFQGLLKPYYSSVDLLEVELVDNANSARVFNPELQEIRRRMIDGKDSDCKSLRVKMHLDEMNRVVIRANKYCWIHIDRTPFSLAIVVPENYGLNMMTNKIDAASGEQMSDYFLKNDWKVHPNWTYCYVNPRTIKSNRTLKNLGPEALVKTFLRLWKSEGERGVDWIGSMETNAGGIASKKLLFCDRLLIESLIFDAKISNINLGQCSSRKKSLRFESDFRLPLKLISTRSGFTRYQENVAEMDQEYLPHDFLPTKSIDEIYYRRSVEFQARMKEKERPSYVFSIPFDSPQSPLKNAYITASKALFWPPRGRVEGSEPLSPNLHQTPIASIAAKIDYQNFAEAFLNHPSICPKSGSRFADYVNSADKCQIDCSSANIDCLLVDNNGFIVASDRDLVASDGLIHDAGLFLGEYDYDLLEKLILSGVFSRATLYDYQAICIAEGEKKSSSSRQFMNPFETIRRTLLWFFGKISVLIINLYFGCGLFSQSNSANSVYFNPSDYNYSYMEAQAHLEYTNNSAGTLIAPARNNFYPCDKFIDLYEAQDLKKHNEPTEDHYSQGILDDSCEHEFVYQHVPRTNLILLVVQMDECAMIARRKGITPEEVNYESLKGDSCAKINHHRDFVRKRPQSCYSYNEREFNMSLMQCGHASNLSSSYLILIVTMIAASIRFIIT